MPNLLDDLRQVGTPLHIESFAAVAADVKGASAALLEAALALPDLGREPGLLGAKLRRYALWLEDATFNPGRRSMGEVETAANVAASLYEFAGCLYGQDETHSIFDPPLHDFLRSAILASFTGYQAHSAYVVRRRIRNHLRMHVGETAEERLQHVAATIIVDFVGRDFHRAISSSVGLSSLLGEAVTALEKRGATNLEIYRVDRSAALALICRQASIGMTLGIPSLISDAEQSLADVATASRDGEDARNYWLANRLRATVNQMSRGSMHRLLFKAGLPESYRLELARHGVFELWEPQRNAIVNGLLGGNIHHNFVAVLPTGAGKTLLAELAVVAALSTEGQSWAVYVAPSRALVSQVSADLKRHLAGTGIRVRTVLAGAEQPGILTEELDLLIESKSVTVTTPEKLDSYYRNAPDLFDGCALVVFDEAHKVADSTRGMLLESLIARFVALQPKTRLILLSGVLSNVEEFVEWMGVSSTRSVVAKRRPTRQLRGVTVRQSEQAGEPKKTSSNTLVRRRSFRGGLALVYENADLGSHITVDVPDLFEGFYTERASGRGWREDRTKSSYYSNVSEHAIQLAGVLARAPETTLVFVGTTAQAESCCRRFMGSKRFRRKAPTKEQEKLAAFIEDELGGGHDLVEACRSGVAFHHAQLPASVQRAIELGLDEGWLQVVFSTPTLREGVNTAATNVIVAGDTYFDSVTNKSRAINEANFENLAGRAGRPFRDSEGRVILIPNSMATARVVESGRKYLLVDDEALRARSQLEALAAWLEKGSGDMLDLPVGDQALVLSFSAAGLTDEEALESFWEQTLWSVQDDATRSTSVARGCARTIRQAEQRVGRDRVQLASKTGFSLSSIETLRTAIIGVAERFILDPLRTPEAGFEELLPPMLEAVLLMPETRRGKLESKPDRDAHFAPLRCWLDAEPYPVILASAVASGALAATSKLGDVVRYCSDLSTWLSWAFGAAYAVLASIIENVDPWIGVLPLLTRYGVPSRAAAYVALLGVSDRIAAHDLGEWFITTGREVTLEEVWVWMLGVNDQLDKQFPDRELRNTLIRRQTSGGQTTQFPFVFAEAEVDRDLRSGQMVSFDFGAPGTLRILDDAGSAVGEVRDDAAVLGFGRGRLETLAGILVLPESARGPAKIAVMQVVPAGS